MKRTTLFWIIAIISTLVFAVYQRVTGPTYPLSGKVNLAGKEISYKLERSQETVKDYSVEIEIGDETVSGILFWRKFNSGENYTAITMSGVKKLTANLPAQKRLEKLDYYIQLSKNNQTVLLPKEKLVTIRFKDPVPIFVLIPHIFAMFFAMMLSTRTGLEFFNKEPQLDKLALWTIIILFIGGFPLGFAMNGYAFGEMWGGWPFGHDVTDNKTQVAFIAWLIAFYFIKKKRNAKLAALLAAIIMLAVYLIPHSV
ncbi:hypothetical protein C0389_03615 [bacterium]|nr:hypothetical protein [bacterium]